MHSAALALLATLVASDALAPLVHVASLLADTTEVQLELLATGVRPMAATRATVVHKAMVVHQLSEVVLDVPVASVAVLASVAVPPAAAVADEVAVLASAAVVDKV